MRIAISGTACTGKSTLISDMIKKWPKYTTPAKTYRALLKNNPHSKQCNKDGQWAILNHLIDDLQKYTKDDMVLFDRAPLDNLIYSMWSFDKGASDIDEPFIEKCIPLVRESMRLLDIIFFIPLTKSSPITIVDDKTREVDPLYITEIDHLFKAILQQFNKAPENSVFFPKGDSPAIIEIFGKPKERIYLIDQYLNEDGDIIGAEGDTVLNPETLKGIEQLYAQQTEELKLSKNVDFQKDLIKKYEKKIGKKLIN